MMKANLMKLQHEASKIFCFIAFFYATLLNAQTTVTFNFTGNMQSWVVPAGITSVDLECYGAQGENSACAGNYGGYGAKGAYAKGTLNVTPGQTLYIFVGGQSGYNGGGLAYCCPNAGCKGGNGGGASDIRTIGTNLTDRILVAAGGGGGGGGSNPYQGGNGGAGGGLTGDNGIGSSGGCFPWSGQGGFGGTQSAGGDGGCGGLYPGTCMFNGYPGSLGSGGNGNNQDWAGGGGGGGGYYGGGGGGSYCANGGGGGGSSYTGGLTNTSTTAGINSGDGIIKITYTESCPCSNGSRNGSFELTCAAPNSIAYVSAVSGWTTNDSNFEIWGTGNEGVAAYHLSNYIEVNSNFPSTIHQDISTCPGVSYYWQAAHRGRLGTQTAVYEVGPIGGPYVTLATMTDGTAWQLYSGNYVIPSGQTTTRIRIRGVNGGSVGNFVDAVGFVPNSTCLTQDLDGDGFSANYGDCADNDNTVKPCAQEICNGKDDDCDGLIDGMDPGFVSTDPNAPEYIDAVLPIITCPGNVNYTTASGNCGPVPSGSISLGTATATDNCIVLTLSNNAPGNYPLGVTNVKWTATDKKGNKGTCIQKVTITPYNCGQAIQIYHSDTTESSAKIKWKAGICATDYQLRLRVELSPGVWGSWGPWDNYNGNPVLQHTFTGLAEESYYNYQIRTKCGIANSINVNGWFHTLPSGGSLKKSRNGISNNTDQELYNGNPTAGSENTLGIQLVPNPARDFVAISLKGFEVQPKQMAMMDLNGKIIFRVELSKEENHPELDLVRLDLPNGTYILHVYDGTNRRIERLIIQK